MQKPRLSQWCAPLTVAVESLFKPDKDGYDTRGLAYRELEMLKQRWQGFHKPPAATGIPATESRPAQHDALAPSMAGQSAVGQQEGISQPNSSTMQQQRWHNGGVPTAIAHPGAEASLSARQTGAGLQGRAAPAGDGSAPAQSPLSAYSPVLGTPVEFFIAAAAAPTVDVLPRSGEGRGVASGSAQHGFLSPNQDLLGKPFRYATRGTCMLIPRDLCLSSFSGMACNECKCASNVRM